MIRIYWKLLNYVGLVEGDIVEDIMADFFSNVRGDHDGDGDDNIEEGH